MLAKDVEARFQALDAFLTEHQGLWRPRPFVHLQLPWETLHPELAQWLRQRSLADAESCHNQPHDLPAPAPFPQLAAQALHLGAVDKLPAHPLEAARHRLNVDVPGRKWQQIEAFGAALQFAETPRHWLDWCAGKGHLGRRLLQPGQQLTCLEYDPALIASGQALSDHHGLPVTHRLQDVMADVSISPEYTPIALHACGDLHVRLLQLASAAGCKQLALAPCCYNRINTDTYQALSGAGRASALQLSIDDLGLPLSETVTAGKRVRQQRDTSMARRLGFDQLQRQLRNCDEYLPTPSLPASWLDKPFADYCQELAGLKGLSTGEQDWPALEAHGWRRLAEVRNLELVRGLFRRPLEMWLVLDRALFLSEQGYKVEIGSFCEPALTPRNVMVLAERD
ncbi:methyltransferase [Pseudomonas costantinii]|uniref:methyltransferase n=1 Tax=Pseudomonas costantinii TaxID=168469 RepID=UPI0015A4441A|nr:methyltransferase [Pseudomonas costantinii]NVZ67908.1 methyltransferase [Pseudomonas costantinii]